MNHQPATIAQRSSTDLQHEQYRALLPNSSQWLAHELGFTTTDQLSDLYYKPPSNSQPHIGLAVAVAVLVYFPLHTSTSPPMLHGNLELIRVLGTVLDKRFFLALEFNFPSQLHEYSRTRDAVQDTM
jgi:hypothetical protein